MIPRDEDYLEIIVNELIAVIEGKQTLAKLKNECEEFIEILRKNGSKRILKVIEDIPQMIEVAMQIEDITIKKRCLKMIADVLYEVVDYCNFKDA